ncbi:hypothetical protein [Allobranchiibius sp. GilTou73]|uniref:hypothetical protein n=1 Tax=Allobranchiibius sp. GilTou73 TaxID=2904523 RepID=UPI001F48CF9D|nr:hypothetical protein [Allobranchiibius sp. GilTou73]UIJ36326.1 hypothetical protein LVQ62_08165 [Allobranchiibius sp. GilTou73]
MRGVGRRVMVTVALAMAAAAIAGCGTQSAPGAPSYSPTPYTFVTAPSSVASPSPPPYDEATSDLAQSIQATGDAHYASTFGLVRLNPSQHGMSVEMTDLALARKLVAGARAGHPTWAKVPVALTKVPYSMKRMTEAQDAVSAGDWRRYQLVSAGIETCRYLSVASSDTRLKDPVAGRAGRTKLAQELSHTVGVPVVVTYSTPAHAD